MNIFNERFTKPIVKIGRIGLLIAAAATFLPPLYLWIFEGVIPSKEILLKDFIGIVSIYGVLYVIEPTSYYPILGTAGTYLSYLSGNVANVRLPALISAQRSIGVEQGTEQGEVIAICAIVGSIVTNTVMMILAAVIGKYILEILPQFVIDSFNLALPAIIGAIVSNYIKGNTKECMFALLIGLALTMAVIVGVPQFFALLLAVIFNIGINLGIYQKRKKTINN